MTEPLRSNGYLPLNGYSAMGEGRSIALSGEDGSIDWWCVPAMDSPPLFDRLLSPEAGGRFSISPAAPFTVERSYRRNSNVHETIFTTSTGRARLTQSLNSGHAGRLPWAELARRLEGVDGVVDFDVEIRFSDRAGTVSPYLTSNPNGMVFHVGSVLGLVRLSPGVTLGIQDDIRITAKVSVGPGDREILAIVAGEDEPLVAPSIAELDARIDSSDEEWRTWSRGVKYDGSYRDVVVRAGLALKLLLYSPTGAIAAAATTSLPERLGGDKNYDYRYAWVRDAGYTITAFLSLGAEAEAKAAFTWLIKQLATHGAQVMYRLEGGLAPDVTEIELSGYALSRPVRVGNGAVSQHQHGIYGDIFGVAWRFVSAGNVLDDRSAATLSDLADQCADRWKLKDSGIWELEDLRHYTISKISCWQALAHAVDLADAGHIPTTCRDRWARECERIVAWIDDHCWSEARSAYVGYAGSEDLDASISLAIRFGFPRRDRVALTLDAIDLELGKGLFHYRYTGASAEEGCFLACSFWMVQARALLGEVDQADEAFRALIQTLDSEGVYPEMIDPDTGDWLGNLPQGLTHLGIVHAAVALAEAAQP